MQPDHQPMNLCFTYLSRTSCACMGGHGIPTVLSSDFANNLFVAGRQDRWMPVLCCVLYLPLPFCGHPSRHCQSLNILCACAEMLALSACLYHVAGHKQPLPRPLKHTQGVQYEWGGHIAWYVLSELYIEADHTTVVWPLFKKTPPNSHPNALPLKRHQAGSICHLNVWLCFTGIHYDLMYGCWKQKRLCGETCDAEFIPQVEDCTV